MVGFIARMIEQAADESIEKGIAKYKAYFYGKARQKLYGQYEDDVDTILTQDGYEAVIVDCRL